MHNPEFFLENETHKRLWDFAIRTDHIILARRPDLEIINQKKSACGIVDFTMQAVYRLKLKENKKKDKYLELAREFLKIYGA